MTASCYLCVKGGYGTLPGTEVGDAVGACRLCGVFACLGHGQRDPGRPAYICGICLANLLAAASSTQISTASPKPPAPKPPDAPKPEPVTAMAYVYWAMGINDPRDVIADYNDLRWASVRQDVDFLARKLSETGLPQDLQVFGGAELERARILMGAAVAIATELKLPFEEMIAELQPVADALLVRRYR